MGDGRSTSSASGSYRYKSSTSMLAKVVIFDLGRHHSAATSSPPIEKLFVSLSGLQLPNPLRLQLVILAGFFLTIYRINKRTGRQETNLSSSFRLIMEPTLISKAALASSPNLSSPTIYPAPSTMLMNFVVVLAFGTMANSAIGALTGLFGSLIWQHDRRVAQIIMSIGGLAGGIGGLLHAIVIVNDRRKIDKNVIDQHNDDFVRVFTRVFSQAPCWSVIGASIGFWIAKKSSCDITFAILILTALAGTLGFACYAMLMCWLTGSYCHLLILQNQVLVLAEKMDIWRDSRIQSQAPYNPLMPEFESSPTKAKQIAIDIKEHE
ncbi:hypothetical protein PCANC_06345 [Puccinia coronata f. sp. avenae]|uniref:Uncharacterized protein n=2 Tax=Puccinia coronata f. sp. avenae TaxID=200324 RepID=A0A2N5T1R4_9BASI|nr:hypothetical protein PCANC_06345 [Puccinia coronata f. sp. avenae]